MERWVKVGKLKKAIAAAAAATTTPGTSSGIDVMLELVGASTVALGALLVGTGGNTLEVMGKGPDGSWMRATASGLTWATLVRSDLPDGIAWVDRSNVFTQAQRIQGSVTACGDGETTIGGGDVRTSGGLFAGGQASITDWLSVGGHASVSGELHVYGIGQFDGMLTVIGADSAPTWNGTDQWVTAGGGVVRATNLLYSSQSITALLGIDAGTTVTAGSNVTAGGYVRANGGAKPSTIPSGSLTYAYLSGGAGVFTGTDTGWAWSGVGTDKWASIGGGVIRTSDRWILGLDLSAIPIRNHQSVITTWHGMQLVGAKKSTIDYTPSTYGTADQYGVLIPIQQTNAVGLAVIAKLGQTAHLQTWLDYSLNELSSIKQSCPVV